jgi:hypothetical protein
MIMPMTVKKLIAELEKIENKYLEVEFLNTEGAYSYLELDRVSQTARKGKVIISAIDKRLR